VNSLRAESEGWYSEEIAECQAVLAVYVQENGYLDALVDPQPDKCSDTARNGEGRSAREWPRTWSSVLSPRYGGKNCENTPPRDQIAGAEER
jgi:hypothetical protein